MKLLGLIVKVDYNTTFEVEIESPPPSHWLARLLYSPLPVQYWEEEDRVGGVEVNLHTSGWPGQQAQA